MILHYKHILILVMLKFLITPLFAQESSNAFKGYYVQVYNQFELVQYYPEKNSVSYIGMTETFQTIGFEIGKYNGAQLFGILLAYGFENNPPENNSEGVKLSEDETNYDSYWRFSGVFRNRIIGTKTTNKFRFHLGGAISLGMQRTRGVIGIGEIFDQQGIRSYPVKSKKYTNGFVEFGPEIQIGGKLKKKGSIFLIMYPIGLNFSTVGIGYNVGRVGLVVQI